MPYLDLQNKNYDQSNYHRFTDGPQSTHITQPSLERVSQHPALAEQQTVL